MTRGDEDSANHKSGGWVTVLVVIALSLGAVIGGAKISSASSLAIVPAPHRPSTTALCPWAHRQGYRSLATATAMSDEVLSKMTLAQKVLFVVLKSRRSIENYHAGLLDLCIPSLTISDGPDGVAGGMRGVTQFPAEIAVGATFDPSIANAVGRAIGAEARAKGINAIQGPDLNLARVPLSGRTFDTFGEDPYLSAILGVADIEGIQSSGVMAIAKHFGAYTQETARVRLNQIVSARVLAEVYDVPFRAAVEQAHVAGLMCAYGALNGVNTCSDPLLYSTLRTWGFTGFVRSDRQAVRSAVAALKAGISLIKPTSPRELLRLTQSYVLPIAALNRAVRSVLIQMFRFGVIDHPRGLAAHAMAATPAHASTALRAAEEGVVLLKNAGGVLPLNNHERSIAIIGTSANQMPVVTGGGSSQVAPPYVVTPLAALSTSLGPRVDVLYAPGGPTVTDMDALSDVEVVAGTPLQLITRSKLAGEPGKYDVAVNLSHNVTNALATATSPGRGRGWARWRLVVKARKTGLYLVSMEGIGDTWLKCNGRAVLHSAGLHARNIISTTISLVANRRYTFSATWFAVRGHPLPSFGIVDVSPVIRQAVAVARRARVAVVFAGDYNSEGVDRSSLSLPGVENALISAVAAANPHTIVVLNTGGAVLMPWLAHVSAVLEAWYPGQVDGTAIAAILSGRVDPSGRLPITFPSSTSASPTSSVSQFPGVNSTVTFASGLDIGYRWYQVHRVRPLFAFGFGLSYTTFRMTNPRVAVTSRAVDIRVSVTNVGARSGADVVEAFVRYPAMAGEPPEQLRSFSRVNLSPGRTSDAILSIPLPGFETYRRGAFTLLPGQYGIAIGSSSASLPVQLSVRLR